MKITAVCVSMNSHGSKKEEIVLTQILHANTVSASGKMDHPECLTSKTKKTRKLINYLFIFLFFFSKLICQFKIKKIFLHISESNHPDLVKECPIFTCITNSVTHPQQQTIMLSNIDQCIATRQNIAAVNKELVAFFNTKNKLHAAQEFLNSITLYNTLHTPYNIDDEDYLSDADTDIED